MRRPLLSSFPAAWFWEDESERSQSLSIEPCVLLQDPLWPSRKAPNSDFPSPVPHTPSLLALPICISTQQTPAKHPPYTDAFNGLHDSYPGHDCLKPEQESRGHSYVRKPQKVCSVESLLTPRSLQFLFPQLIMQQVWPPVLNLSLSSIPCHCLPQTPAFATKRKFHLHG